MSHFTKVKTKMTDAETIKSALEKLGYKVLPGAAVSGWAGKKTSAEFKIKPQQGHYEIGFVKNSSTYEMVADWSMMGINQSDFAARLIQGYGRAATIDKLGAEGYELVEEKVDRTGEIRMLLRRTL